MKLNYKKIDFKNLSFLKKFKSSISIMLWVCVFVIAVLTGFIIYGEYKKLSQAHISEEVTLDKIVRVNIEKHKQIIKQLNDNSSFQPKTIEKSNSFGIAPDKAPAKNP